MLESAGWPPLARRAFTLNPAPLRSLLIKVAFSTPPRLTAQSNRNQRNFRARRGWPCSLHLEEILADWVV